MPHVADDAAIGILKCALKSSLSTSDIEACIASLKNGKSDSRDDNHGVCESLCEVICDYLTDQNSIRYFIKTTSFSLFVNDGVLQCYFFFYLLREGIAQSTLFIACAYPDKVNV